MKRITSFDNLAKCEAGIKAVCDFENHRTPNNLVKMQVCFGKVLTYTLLANGDFGNIITAINTKIGEFYSLNPEFSKTETQTVSIESQLQDFIDELPKNRKEELDFLETNLIKSYNKAIGLFTEIIKAGGIKAFINLSFAKDSGVPNFKGHPLNENKDLVAYRLTGGDRVIIDKQTNLIELIGDPKAKYNH